MTDQELLELAARAAGLGWIGFQGSVALVQPPERPTALKWNPLTNDGDALRLLASLPSLWSLGLKFGSPSIVVDVAWGFKGIKVEKFNGEGTERTEVIRRAIVEAAAEIGASRAKAA
jgi:hypothetical protein